MEGTYKNKKICDTIFDGVEFYHIGENLADDERIQREIFEAGFEKNFNGDCRKLIDKLIKEVELENISCYFGTMLINKNNKNKILKELEGI